MNKDFDKCDGYIPRSILQFNFLEEIVEDDDMFLRKVRICVDQGYPRVPHWIYSGWAWLFVFAAIPLVMTLLSFLFIVQDEEGKILVSPLILLPIALAYMVALNYIWNVYLSFGAPSQVMDISVYLRTIVCPHMTRCCIVFAYKGILIDQAFLVYKEANEWLYAAAGMDVCLREGDCTLPALADYIMPSFAGRAPESLRFEFPNDLKESVFKQSRLQLAPTKEIMSTRVRQFLTAEASTPGVLEAVNAHYSHSLSLMNPLESCRLYLMFRQMHVDALSGPSINF